MIRRLPRIAGIVLVVPLGVVTPIVATSGLSPASADTVIDGCTIASNPTPTHFTNCPGAALFGANLSGLDLSFANFSGSFFAGCVGGSSAYCALTGLRNANLTDANLTGIVFLSSGVVTNPPFRPLVYGDADFAGADLSGANLSNDVLVANFTNRERGSRQVGIAALPS